MTQPEGLPEGGSPMWSNGYLPTVFQGTQLRGGKTPILNLDLPQAYKFAATTASAGLFAPDE